MKLLLADDGVGNSPRCLLQADSEAGTGEAEQYLLLLLLLFPSLELPLLLAVVLLLFNSADWRGSTTLTVSTNFAFMVSTKGSFFAGNL